MTDRHSREFPYRRLRNQYEGGLQRLVMRIEKLKLTDPRPQVLPTVVNHGHKPWTLVTQGWNFDYYLIDIPSIDLDKLPDGEIASWWIRCERAQTREEALDALFGAFNLAARDEDESLRQALHARVAEKAQSRNFPSYEWCEAEWRGEDSMPNALAKHMRELSETEQAKGRAEGLAAQRALLCDLTTQRFDEAISGQLSGLLARIDDFERLAEVGRSIIACETGEELLSRVNGAKAKPRRNARRSRRGPRAS